MYQELGTRGVKKAEKISALDRETPRAESRFDLRVRIGLHLWVGSDRFDT